MQRHQRALLNQPLRLCSCVRVRFFYIGYPLSRHEAAPPQPTKTADFAKPGVNESDNKGECSSSYEVPIHVTSL